MPKGNSNSAVYLIDQIIIINTVDVKEGLRIFVTPEHILILIVIKGTHSKYLLTYFTDGKYIISYQM